MIDIVGIGTDLRLFDAQTSKAANVLSVQLGNLEYAQDLTFVVGDADKITGGFIR